MVGGREIGPALFNNGGIPGVDIGPFNVRSVLILGGLRGPDVPGKSDNVCLLWAGRAADAVCGSSRGGTERGKDGSVGRGVNEGGNSGVVNVCVGAGCTTFGGELGGIGRTGGDGLNGKKAGALGFSGILKGKGAVSGGGGWGSSSSKVFGGGSANEVSSFVAGWVDWAVDVGRKDEGGVCEDVNPFEWWGCSADSDGFTG